MWLAQQAIAALFAAFGGVIPKAMAARDAQSTR